MDGASYAAADFMTNLLAFAFMLRNAGIDDQQLVEHLSEATAGSLTGTSDVVAFLLSRVFCDSKCKVRS